MKTRTILFFHLLIITLLMFSCNSDRSWQHLSDIKLSDAVKQAQEPPSEYCATVTWGWNGPMSHKVIERDLDALYKRGFRTVTIEAGYRMNNAPYLSDEWFAMIRYAVDEAKKRNMRVWIIDEGKYPSGFAGGKFSQERPDLRMQGLGIAEKIELTDNQSIDKDLADNVVSAVAVNLDNETSTILDTQNNKLHWQAPSGKWEIRIIDHQFRTPVTRAVNDSTGAKTTKNSMGNLLDPQAVAQFINWTHEGYKQFLGDEFGKTVLGFRGDEPDFGHIPWTTGMLDTFMNKKGYDVKPYLASFFAPTRTDKEKRARADYWDVWSELFGNHFFGMQADWCAQNNVEYMTHLNNEHVLPKLFRSTGDFFRPMRKVQIPGVDAIWNQVWPGTVADFVKLASSASHLYGRPRALSESYAAYNPRPDCEQVLWGVNYQLVRGINLFEFMFYGASSKGQVNIRGYMGEEKFPQVMQFTNAASFLLSQGRPAANIGIYFPTQSYWLDDWRANDILWETAHKLVSNQRDFDIVDEQALSEVLTLQDGKFVNQSYQYYSTLIIPGVSAISQASLERVKAFAKAGGTLIFLNKTPELITDKSFMQATAPAPANWMQEYLMHEFTREQIEKLPHADVLLDSNQPELFYMHRTFPDGELYFFFNEGEKPITCQASLKGSGTIKELNILSGVTTAISAIEKPENMSEIKMRFDANEAKFILIEK